MADGVLRQRFRRWVWSVRATLLFTGLLVLVYGVQLAAAGSLEHAAAYSVAKNWLGHGAGVFLVLSPLLHSSHDHLLSNLRPLLFSGVVTERRVGSWSAVRFTYGTAALANILAPLLGIGGRGLGVSSAFYGLWTFIFVTFALEFMSELTNEYTRYWRLIPYGVLAGWGFLYATTGVLQYLRVLPASQGVAKGAHFLGIVFGVVWFMSRQFELNVDLVRAHLVE